MKVMHALLAAAALASAAPASAELDLNRADISRLPNGLTVILLEDRSLPVVSVQMLYKSGSAAEVTGKTGLAHFLEHLAFRASANFPNGRATELIYDAGGEWHGYTAMDQTTYFATMPKDGLDLLLRIEADRMARTVIDPASIEAEKGAVITELHSYENDPASVLQEAVTRTALQAHAYGSPMAGYVSDVEQLTIDDAKAYYASHYAPGNAVLAIAGDIELTKAKALVAKAFADVPARAVAKPHSTAELPQRGERRIRMSGPVDKQYFQMAFPAPAASSPDFPVFLVLQQFLAGTPGLNPRQSGWSGTAVEDGKLLSGAAEDIATWLPTTHDPFLFIVSGSADTKLIAAAIEADIARRLATPVQQPIPAAHLARAKADAIRALADDVQTTEDAAHQLAFFEGIGALDALLDMPRRVEAVTAADIKRVAGAYLAPDRRTIGWMVPGNASPAALGIGNPKAASDRAGKAAPASATAQPQLRKLSGGLPAIVQSSPLTDSVTVEMLLSAPAEGGATDEHLPGLGTVVRSGRPSDLPDLVRKAIAAIGPSTAPEPRSEDPVTRLEQLTTAQINAGSGGTPAPLAVVVSGNIQQDKVYAELERQLGTVATTPVAAGSVGAAPKSVRERIARPLSQGALGYVAEGPKPGTRAALAWRMLLYVLTHDYSGRLGRSAINDKGLVYHIYSQVRTDGRRTWATISTGVDPGKADATEAELRAQLANLVANPPSPAEVHAARSYILGRDLTAAQSNEEIAAKLAREFIETGGLRSHERLREQIQAITSADLAAMAPSLANGTLIRVDVGAQE